MSLTILLLDTETNGLPKNRFAPVSEFTAWPAILQLSWAIYRIDPDGTMENIESRDVGVSLDPGIPWDTGAAAIHGLSEVEGRHGTPARTALTELAAALRRVSMIVAHNLSFDKSVIRAAGYAEASRSPDAADLRKLWPSDIQELCTMRETTELVCMPPTAKQVAYNVSKYKSPRLNELFQWLFGHGYDVSGAVLHTAKSDVHCLAQCVGELIRRKALTLSRG
jgi:DNA polymerase-3 subunit alpha